MTLSIKGLFVTLRVSDTQRNNCHYAECYYAESRILLIVMLSVVMLRVIVLGVVAPWGLYHKT